MHGDEFAGMNFNTISQENLRLLFQLMENHVKDAETAEELIRFESVAEFEYPPSYMLENS